MTPPDDGIEFTKAERQVLIEASHRIYDAHSLDYDFDREVLAVRALLEFRAHDVGDTFIYAGYWRNWNRTTLLLFRRIVEEAVSECEDEDLRNSIAQKPGRIGAILLHPLEQLALQERRDH